MGIRRIWHGVMARLGESSCDNGVRGEGGSGVFCSRELLRNAGSGKVRELCCCRATSIKCGQSKYFGLRLSG